jgi:glycosyltransferase involved in cell wall biosynthesis
MPITYISWAPHCSRSDHTARELGGTSHMIYWGRLGSRPSTIWLKYLGQTLETWLVLARERADAVFVMSPPPVAVIAVYLACLFSRTPFVIDAHSGAFQHPRWKIFQPVHFWLCRRARTTIVTNEHLASLVRGRGGHSTVVPDVPVRYAADPTAPPRDDEFTVVCVTSFDRDEPIAALFEAARRLPELRFLMTGNPAGPNGLHGLQPPANVTLTGFLEESRYGALLQRASVVLALTTDDHTMQRGAWEAIYQGTPVIVSDFGILRQAFDEGAIHVNNSPEAIVEAVLHLKARVFDYRSAAQRLRARKQARWASSKRALMDALRTARPTDPVRRI